MRNDPLYTQLFSTLADALGSFDKSKDWPDFIKFLKNIQRARHRAAALTLTQLQAIAPYTNLPSIPHEVTVSKRLSQCLNPALPSGVHKTALEVRLGHGAGVHKPLELSVSEDISHGAVS